jgi:dihydrofolate synthase/folylpolyglutamate synthase
MRVEDIISASGGIAEAGPTVSAALGKIAAKAKPGRVLIAGSLYLAGEALKADEV